MKISAIPVYGHEIKIIDLKDYKTYCIISNNNYRGFNRHIETIYELRKDYASKPEYFGLIEKLYTEITLQFINPEGEDVYLTYYIDFDDAKTKEEAIIKAKELFYEEYMKTMIKKDVW